MVSLKDNANVNRHHCFLSNIVCQAKTHMFYEEECVYVCMHLCMYVCMYDAKSDFMLC